MNATRPSLIELYRRFAGILLAMLLGLYLIFNKSAALLGWPPLYIGEIVLLVTLPVLLIHFRHDVSRALQQSWGMNLVAAFLAYGCGHVVYDWQTYGSFALRDGVLAGYAVLAFLAPALWRSTIHDEDDPLHLLANSNESALSQRGGLGLSGRVWLGVLLGSGASLYWAKTVMYTPVDMSGPLWKEHKADFLTLAVAVSAWIFFISALRFCPFCCLGRLGKYKGLSTKIIHWVGFVFLCIATIHALMMLIPLPTQVASILSKIGFDVPTSLLPTRAVLISVLPIAGVCLLVVPSKLSTQKTLAWLAVLISVVGALFVGLKFRTPLNELNAEYQLASNLDWSIAELEAHLKTHPETYPVFDVNLDLSNLDSTAQHERLGSIFSPNEEKFSTHAGQRGAHANKWRLIYWQRVFNFTTHQAPFTGLGFGPNLTNLNRQTPAWPMYLPAMSVGLRSPHSAHLSIYARMGLVGLVLWFGILFSTLTGAVGTLWRHRTHWTQSGMSVEFQAQHHSQFFSLLAVLGVWLIYLCTMTFSVTLENPMGGMPFWALTGVLLMASRRK